MSSNTTGVSQPAISPLTSIAADTSLALLAASTTTPWSTPTTTWASTTPASTWSAATSSAYISTESLLPSSTPSTTPSSTLSTTTSSTLPAAATTSPATSHKGTPSWLAGVIVGCLAGVALLAGLVFWLLRRRRQNSQKYTAADQFDSSGAPPPSSAGAGLGLGHGAGLGLGLFGTRHQRLLSQVDMDEAESQRRAIIRKSIISRTSMSASQLDLGVVGAGGRQAEHQHGLENEHNNNHEQSLENDHNDHNNNKRSSLRDDWKEWEAQMERQKTALAQQHPAQHEPHEMLQAQSQNQLQTQLQPQSQLPAVSPVSTLSPTDMRDAYVAPVSPASTISIMPPVPPRSRMRPLSTDWSADPETQTQAQPQAQPQTQSQSQLQQPADPPLQRRPTLRDNPLTRHMSRTDPESPSSLYSVDLQGGRQNRMWANYHHDD